MNMAEPTAKPTASLRGVLRLNEPMAKHVGWRAGGAAARAYSPADSADLAVFLATLPAHEPVCFVGLGSNLLVRDGGFRGTVVLMHNPGGAMRAEGNLIYSEAGTASPKVARFAATHGFEGRNSSRAFPARSAARSCDERRLLWIGNVGRRRQGPDDIAGREG
jgi:UDP-N-acetylmuramate dehydrogenase